MTLKDLGREALLLGAGAVLAALVVGLILDLLIMPMVTRQGMQIEVPDVSGKTATEAQAILAQKRLKLHVEEERWSPGVPDGHILLQRPGPATRVKEGRTIYVSISRGDKPFTVPDLTTGMSLREARFRVEQAGLVLGQVEEIPSEALVGTVVGQRPEPGTQVSRGSAVNLQVSRGSAPPFPAPGLVGSDTETAFARLDSLGLSVGHVEYREEAGAQKDKVLEQKPEAGVQVRAGDKIDLIISE
ncbi:MAG: PASTA domain-containing protein [Candidatus Latescibacteria bacterium]|nr:PASTA domain-containing protein [Candidatus Latescibacterota bacterium]